MNALMQDVRYAIRLLGKSPGFTAIVVLTLALGIGANTAIFSVVNGVLLNPLPYPHPKELVVLYENTREFHDSSISYPNFLDWQRENTAFTQIAAFRSDIFSLTGAGEAERVRVSMVSAGFFEILGVQPVIGQTFTKDEDQAGAAPVAIVTEGFWKQKFGGSGDIVGRRVTMNGKGYTIVGVVPSTVRLGLLNFANGVDVYTPVGQFDDPLFYNRDVHEGMDAIGRLKPGVTLAQAREDMSGIAKRLSAAYPDADKGRGVTVVGLKEEMVGPVRTFLLVLLGAVGFVLLIACVNVANLQLTKSASRSREFAIRVALGASQGRVMRQLLTESLLLAAAGGALGLALANWGTKAALSVLPEALPRVEDVGLDTRVLLFTLGISVFAGVVFGMAPALKTSRPKLQETLKESGRGESGVRHRAQGAFVAAETALALVLLAGAGLMIRSLAELWSVNPGFNPHHALTFGVSMDPAQGKTAADTRAAFRSLQARLLEIPGVEAASVTSGTLPMNGDSELPFWVEGRPKPAETSQMELALTYLVDGQYLKAMGIRLIRGRFLTAEDNENSPGVVVIDEDFARQYFPGEDPIGKQINLGIVDMHAQIVGIVDHVKHWGLASDANEKIHAQMYMPFLQVPDRFFNGPPEGEVVVRSEMPAQALTARVRKAVEGLSTKDVIFDEATYDEIISKSLAARRFTMILLGAFAGLALLLSSVGIYGVISHVVGERTHEIGIRMALGAQPEDVMRQMLSEGMKMTALGLGIGLAGALALTRLMDSILYGVSARDPLTFAGVAILLSGVALLACILPARRAMRIDPMAALRYE